MHIMVTQWMILAVVSLALGEDKAAHGENKAAHGEDQTHRDEVIQQVHQLHSQQQNIPLAVQCCKSERVLPAIVTQIKLGCLNSGLALRQSKSETEKMEKGCKLIGCLLEKKRLVKPGEPVDEKSWRNKFSKKLAPVMKPIVQSALDKCFKDYNELANKAESSLCPGNIGAEQLFGCITSTIVANCPKSMWHSWTKPQCKEALAQTEVKE